MRSLTMLLLLANLTTGLADDMAAEHRDGSALFDRHCTLCHAAGAGHPGTMRLTARVGAGQSVLLGRGDLEANYVGQVIRTGFEMMPPFRPSEISDAEVAKIAAFVAARNAANGAR